MINTIEICNGEIRVEVGTEDNKFIYRVYKNNELVIPDGPLIEHSDIILQMAFEIQTLKSRLDKLYSGDEIPTALLDDNHIDYTYKVAQYYKNIKEGKIKYGTDNNGKQ